jgi:hypothetical protein
MKKFFHNKTKQKKPIFPLRYFTNETNDIRKIDYYFKIINTSKKKSDVVKKIIQNDLHFFFSSGYVNQMIKRNVINLIPDILPKYLHDIKILKNLFQILSTCTLEFYKEDKKNAFKNEYWGNKIISQVIWIKEANESSKLIKMEKFFENLIFVIYDFFNHEKINEENRLKIMNLLSYILKNDRASEKIISGGLLVLQLSPFEGVPKGYF